tara:strand:+ start:322 stop:759 length:438 start_codon:yes stop_codon:yes gene_type:complete
MNTTIAIDPGMSKCGLILADVKDKKVFKAEVIHSNCLMTYVKEIYQKDNRLQCIIGDGTGSKKYIERLRTLIPNLIVAQERNSTYRAKERYFEIYPLLGLKKFLPREIFILNKNLDALAALIIIEDYHKCKFEISNKVSTKTWLK